MAMNRWGRSGNQNTTMCSAQSISKTKQKMLHRSHPAEHSVWAQIHVHRVTDLEIFPVRISKDEAPTPLPVVGPLFISPLSFHLSRALLGAWRFGLFCCVYSSFHNRLDLIREPTFYWVFYFIFPIYPVCFIICKDKNVLLVLVRSTSDFVASLGYGLGLGRFLPLTVFSLSAPFVSRVIAFIYDVRMRGVVSWASAAPQCCCHC